MGSVAAIFGTAFPAHGSAPASTIASETGGDQLLSDVAEASAESAVVLERTDSSSVARGAVFRSPASIPPASFALADLNDRLRAANSDMASGTTADDALMRALDEQQSIAVTPPSATSQARPPSVSASVPAPTPASVPAPAPGPASVPAPVPAQQDSVPAPAPQPDPTPAPAPATDPFGDSMLAPAPLAGASAQPPQLQPSDSATDLMGLEGLDFLGGGGSGKNAVPNANDTATATDGKPAVDLFAQVRTPHTLQQHLRTHDHDSARLTLLSLRLFYPTPLRILHFLWQCRQWQDLV